MTSDPDSEARTRLAALLTTTPKHGSRSAYRGGYAVSPEDEKAWRRASEQERRRMLKDCGWL